jgi:hypothetical protein
MKYGQKNDGFETKMIMRDEMRVRTRLDLRPGTFI